MDPFTTVTGAILSSLKASRGFSRLVRPGNLVDMTADSFERFKTQLQPGDTPEVVLLQTDFVIGPFGQNSQSADLSQTWLLIATHDSLRARPVNQLKFQTMLALLGGGTDLGLEGLVRTWRITGASDDAFGPREWRRGTARWVSVLAITVEMSLSRRALLGEL